MQFIAHRVLRDGEPAEALDPALVAGFDGLELDLRLDPRGRLIVDHAPVFAGLRRRPASDSLEAALDVIGALRGVPRRLLLDVKCVTAATAAARLVEQRGMEREVIFACWHAAEVDAIRETLPGATILYCIAPIVASRAPKGRLQSLYVTNVFPFFWSAANFAPRLDKRNRHNINVKLVSRSRGITTLPPRIDGVCVHRVFWTPSLAAIAAAQGLSVAVYGLRSRAHAQRLAADRGAFDYAIIGSRQGGARASARRSLRRSA
jgi:glycerophosphoryl diester phosphodiesterase